MKLRLDQPGLFRVIFIDVLEELDVNSLQYPEVCLAVARRLFEEISTIDDIGLDPVFLTPLKKWFDERMRVHGFFSEFSASVEAGTEVSATIPWYTKVFARLTTAFKVSSTVKEEIRTIFKNSFKDFAAAFNGLVEHVESKLRAVSERSRILFIVDGTDRLDRDDSSRFFVQDVHQLQQITGLFLYCAPIHLLYNTSSCQQYFDHVRKVPALKVHEKHDPRTGEAPILEPAGQVLRELITRRAPAELFEPDPAKTADWSTVDYFIRYSGGHLRDLLRLLDYAFELATGDCFDMASATAAVKALGADYRRFLQPEDFQRLAEIDCRGPEYCPVDERSQGLLYNLALLEYNDFWWQSHPVVRTLPAYKDALAKITQPGNGP